MRKIVFKVFLFSIVAVFLISGIYIWRHFHSILEKTVIYMVNKQSKDWDIDAFHFKTYKLNWPHELKVDQIEFTLIYQQKKIRFNIHLALLKNLEGYYKKKENLDVSLTKVEIQFDEFHVLESNIFCHVKNEQQFSGHLDARNVKVGNLKLEQLTGAFESNVQQLKINPVKAQFYAGHLVAEILLEYQPQFPYSMNVNLTNVDLKRLKEVNPSVLNQVEGVVDVIIRLSSNISQSFDIEGSLIAPQGGFVRAVLLKFLLAYIPKNSKQKNDLEMLIKDDKNVFLDRAKIDFKSKDDRQLSTHFDLESKSLNINTNTKVDWNIEGGLNNLFKLSFKPN